MRTRACEKRESGKQPLVINVFARSILHNFLIAILIFAILVFAILVFAILFTLNVYVIARVFAFSRIFANTKS